MLATLLVGTAHAQRGIDPEPFRPAVDSFGLLSVERALSGEKWQYGFKLWTGYAHRPLQLALRRDANDATPPLSSVMDWQVVLHFGAHLSFTNWLELALDVPMSAQGFADVYGQPYDTSVDPATSMPRGPTGFYAAQPRTNVGTPNAAPLDARVALKARTRRFGSQGQTGLALVVAATVPFGDSAAFLGNGGFTFRPNAIFDVAVGRFVLALNVGAIVRSATVVLDPLDVVNARSPAHPLIAVGHELAPALGVSVRLARFLALTGNAYALVPLTSTDGATKDYVVGGLVGFDVLPGRDVTISVGGGADNHASFAAARAALFRAFLALSWSPSGAGPGAGARSTGGGGDRDRDGIPDGVDQCPSLAEDKDGFEDADGCPDPDNDRDGILDGADQCPNDPEDLDGFQDEDGCPDPDNDRDGVPDAADQCPNDAEDKDGWDDADGCPDPDNDADGIPDVNDRCPDEPETRNGIDDEDGCPDTGPLVTPGAPQPTAPADGVRGKPSRADAKSRHHRRRSP